MKLPFTQQEIARLKVLAMPDPAPEDTAIGRFFQWLDMLLSKFTRTWMYILEIMGMSFLYYYQYRVDEALTMLKVAETEDTVLRATKYLDQIHISFGNIAIYVVVFCALMPVIIATLRTVRKRWILKAGPLEMTQEFTGSNGDSRDSD